MAFDLSTSPACEPTVWISGVIVGENAGVAGVVGAAHIKDDQGTVHILVWGSKNPAFVDWNRRYRIGGKWYTPETGGQFWACGGADSVIPE